MKSDPMYSAIYDGIKRGVEVCLENDCFGSAIILIYSGIDTMAYLAMPKDQIDVTRDDYIQWCNRYIKLTGSEQISGLELYSARCGMLHTYGVESRQTRSGNCRMLGYMDQSIPEVRYSKEINPNFALVSIKALATAFNNGIDRFLVDLFTDSERAAVAEERLQKLVVASPTAESGEQQAE